MNPVDPSPTFARCPATGAARSHSSVLVYLYGFLLLAGVSSALLWNADVSRRESIIRDAGLLSKVLLANMHRYETMLQSVVGYFEHGDDVTQDQWREFTATLKLRERFPGLQGVGYAARVTADQVARVTAKARAEMGESFSIWPSVERQEAFPILFLEPLDERNRRAIGYNMFLESARHEAMMRAMVSGGPAVSGLVTLVQENGENLQKGFLLYRPVYRSLGESSATNSGPRELLGFAYSPFRVKELFPTFFDDEVVARIAAEREFLIFDGNQLTKEFLIFGNHELRSLDISRVYDYILPVAVGGRNWTIVIRHAEQGYLNAHNTLLFLVVCGAVGFLLCLFVLFLRRKRLVSAGADILGMSAAPPSNGVPTILS